MEKSTTERKSDFQQAQKTFAEFGTKYLKNWTHKEIKKFVTEPVVIPVGNRGFFVGPYTILGKAKNCWQVQQLDGRHIHDFVLKSNAILYCLQSMKNKEDSQDLLELDRKLGNLENDIVFYKFTIQNTKSQLKNSVALNRYIDATMQRRYILNILRKTLISAKYLNFGKQPL